MRENGDTVLKTATENETGLDVETLETSFAAIASQAEALVARFYSELFCRHPAVESLFVDTDMQTQQGKLLAALKLVVDNVRHPEKLLPTLRELGQRHRDYGAEPEHYAAVAETLVDVMSEIAGPAWTPQMETAWNDALGVIADIMLGAYTDRAAGHTETIEDTTEDTDMGSYSDSDAADNARIKQALDCVTANVMVADADLNIVYMNDTVGEMFRAAESDIRKELPRFDVKNLLGTNIDEFHKDPAHQRRTLAELTETLESKLTLGGRTFQIIANPILDDNRERVGTVVEWQDLTEQLAREEADRQRAEAEARIAAENGRIKQALDGVTTNVMIGDNDLNIIYMNDAVSRLFREVEADVRKDLPNFDASNLMGTCIDLFHKNPAHQRNMLAGLSATHTAELSIGGRTMRVIASPVFSDEGERLGTVVEWADRTQELAVEQEVQQVVDSALAGDLAQRISLDGKEGFFERLSNAVNELVGVAERVIADTLRVFGAMSGGNLTETIEGEYAGSFGQLKSDANETIAKLTEIVGRIQSASNSVKTGADEISQGNTDLSQRTEEQASSLEETASSMEEMTSTVKQNADNAGEANQLAKAAREQAEKGGAVVRQAVDAMNEINASSKKISDIIGVIDEIAFQTNLLALNASVEAARAGDQGRGFAVVASEVRNLAGRSATAAKEIKDLIEDSGRKVDEGSRLVNDSGETLDEIVNGVKKVTDIVGEIAAASQEQSAGIDQVNKAVMQLDELTQQNAALVEQAAAASESMGEQADGLNQLIQFFAVDHGHAAGAAAYEGRPSGGIERRSAERPWTPPPSQPAAAAAAPPPPPRRAAANGRDQEWEEF